MSAAWISVRAAQAAPPAHHAEGVLRSLPLGQFAEEPVRTGGAATGGVEPERGVPRLHGRQSGGRAVSQLEC